MLLFTPKQRGELAELKFDARAGSLGLHLARPHGDSLPFDRIIIARLLHRVQIKSTSVHRKHVYSLMVHRAGIRPYQRGEFDLLAVLVNAPREEDCAWYIIPFDAIAGRSSIKLHTLESGRTGPFSAFRERWDLFD